MEVLYLSIRRVRLHVRVYRPGGAVRTGKRIYEYNDASSLGIRLELHLVRRGLLKPLYGYISDKAGRRISISVSAHLQQLSLLLILGSQQCRKSSLFYDANKPFYPSVLPT